MDDNQILLKSHLERRFLGATLIEDEIQLQELSEKIINFIEQKTTNSDTTKIFDEQIQLNLCGTEFQKRVWNALCSIPRGSTTTYSKIATQIGMPKACRAVAGACAANPIAVIIPCHRVIRSDGAISGYRWGVERKVELLRRESK